jgi:hypothetical protein
MRKQKMGRQRGWSFEDIKKGFEQFYKIHKRYPTSREIDSFEFLPSSRSIQRRFGGLVETRKALNLKSSSDFRTGEHSSQRAKKISERAHLLEKQIYDYLINIFGVEFVHREFFFTDDRRARTDFFIYCKNGNFSVDVFYPNDRYNFVGCLNSKMNTYGNKTMLQYPVIFLQMNDELKQEEIENILKRKKNKLLKYQSVMNLNEFKKFCSNKSREKVVPHKAKRKEVRP